MIPVPGGVRVWLATGVTDMRRGMNTLALQVQEDLGHDPHAGDLYIFRGRRGDLVKILWHDGVGDLALCQAPGAGSVPVAGDDGRRGVDQRGAARLPARRNRLAEPGSDLAAVAGGVIRSVATRPARLL